MLEIATGQEAPRRLLPGATKSEAWIVCDSQINGRFIEYSTFTETLPRDDTLLAIK